MVDYLIRKQTGYMTCCPDEENTIGYYTFKDPDNVEVYTEPSYDSETYNKVLDRKHELWKYNHSDVLNLTSQDMNTKFGNIYTLEDIDFRIGPSIGLWGWEKVNNKEEKTTWIRVHEDKNLWIPFEHYQCESSDEEEETTNPQEDKVQCWGCLNNEPNQMAHECCGY
jgi:hypothetical protein